MDCECWDYDAPEVFEKSMPKARARHRCCECGGAIQPGERYERARGLWDGHWDTYKTCADCLHIRCETGCKCFIYGGLADAVSGDERLNGMFMAVQRSRRKAA